MDDVYLTAEQIQQRFGIGLNGKNGQPLESMRWPKGKKTGKYHHLFTIHWYSILAYICTVLLST